MNSWKTTVAGIGLILTALGIVAAGLGGDGSIDFGEAGAAFMAGIGLLLARDNDKSSESAGAK